MKQDTEHSRAQLFGLVDAAACPEKIFPLLERSGERFQSVYSGLPEEEAGPASLYAVSISNEKAEWAEELSRIDLHSPCLSLLRSRIDLDSLVTHLQAFLFADIGDNITVLVRFFDPRNIEVVRKVWGEQVRNMFMGPFEQWMFRGRHASWQSIRNDSRSGVIACRSVVLHINQSDVDTLMAHTEPDELLATLVGSGITDGERPYLERFTDFYARYQRAQRWDLTEAADRLVFCQHTYRYGSDFDHHYRLRDLLSNFKASGQSLNMALQEIPEAVWKEISQTHRLQIISS
jgi:hypothetical protein